MDHATLPEFFLLVLSSPSIIKSGGSYFPRLHVFGYVCNAVLSLFARFYRMAETGKTWGQAAGNPESHLMDEDCERLKDLINGIKAGAVIVDKGYDANKLEAKIAEQGSELVIPPKRKRKSPRAYNKDLYPITKISIRTANLIERFFAKLKQFRRGAKKR